MSPLKKILFTLITLILVLGAAEGALRLMGELGEGEGESIQYGGLRLLPDPQLIFKLAPGEFTFQGVHYRQNRQGWRMGNIPRAKAPGEFRVMFLGDSSIWGDGVEEGKTLSFHAEEILHISTPRKVVTINAATPGYSSLQSRLLLKRDVDRVKPDLVVIASLWSDLMAMGETDASLLKRISTERGEGAPWWTSSALLHELGRITDGLKHGEEPYRMALDRIFAPQKEGHKGEARVPVAEHFANLEAMIKECRSRKIHVLLLRLTHQAFRYGWKPGRIEPYRANYTALARKYGLSLLDVQELFGPDQEGQDDLFLDGLHPSVRGHQVIGSAVAERILSYLK